MEGKGWAVLRKDGSGFKLDALDGWWIVARGDDVIFSRVYQGVFSFAPSTGASTLIAEMEFPRLHHSATCLYDAGADEVGCLNYGIVAYDFKSAMTRPISSHTAIQETQLGSNRLAFNRTHWFAPVSLPSGGGIGAFPRDGSGSVVFHEKVAALGPVTVDEQHLYACLAGALTRVSLVDGGRGVLTDDCGNAEGLSLLGMDAGYVYYVQASRNDPFYPRVSGETLSIFRVARTRF